MKRLFTILIALALLAIAHALTDTGAKAASQAEDAAVKARYTKERPIVVGVQWYLAPYEFNRAGKATGYNVDVIEATLKDAGLPYTFVFRSPQELFREFVDKKIDIIADFYDGHRDYGRKVYGTTTILAIYRPRIAYLKGTRPIHNIREMLPDDTLALKPGDYSDNILTRDSSFRHSQIIYDTPKACINKLLTHHCRYFIWGEKCMRRSIDQLGLDNIVIDSIDIPEANIRLAGTDKELITHIDRHIARLEQAGKLYKLNIKWFHPEQLPDPVSGEAIAFSAALIIAILAIFYFNRRINRRIDDNLRQVRERTAIFRAAISMSNRSLEYFDLERKRIFNISGHHVPEDGMSEADYQAHIHTEDIDELNQFVLDIISGQKGSKDRNVFRWNRGTAEHPHWVTMEHYASLETDDRGNPVNVICALNDITDLTHLQKHHDEVARLLKDTGDNAPIGLMLYDGNGKLLRCNRAMVELMHFTGYDDPLAKANLFDVPTMQTAINRQITEQTCFCCNAVIPERNLNIYVEVRVKPILDNEGHLRFILISRRDITQVREAYLQQRRNNEEIRRQNKDLRQLEENIRQLLHANKAREWRSDFRTSNIHFYGLAGIRGDMTLTFKDIEALTEGDDEAKRRVADFFNPKDKSDIGDKSLLVKGTTLISNSKYAGHWFNITRVPQYGRDGGVKGCFGLLHDVTEQMQTIEQLKERTRKANESEKMKSVFLANMTHEIRTPLNAIVGFCDLLQSMEGEEKQQLIDIIHNNCNMLVHLINDILTVSEMETTGLTVNPRDVNFGRAFSEVCSTLAQQAEGKGLKLVVHNPYGSLNLHVDNERLQQVVINFGTNAIKHTTQGQIDLGYELADGGLRIYCRDTGSGMPKDRLDDIFERFVKLNDFVQGTGLGLNICKAIADVCGGRIGVESEEGVGSNFWIWIPCKANE